MRYRWIKRARVYRRVEVRVVSCPVGGSLVELARAPDRLLREQMEAVLQDAVAFDTGTGVVWDLGAEGRQFWRAIRPHRSEHLV